MDIRPVDVQMFINKTSQLNKSEDNNQKANDQNLMFSDHLKKNFESENQKTIESNKSEEQNISKDGRGNKGSYQKNKKNKKQQEQEKDKKTKKSSMSFLDISI